jgi:hypothetical protein
MHVESGFGGNFVCGIFCKIRAEKVRGSDRRRPSPPILSCYYLTNIALHIARIVPTPHGVGSGIQKAEKLLPLLYNVNLANMES